MMTNKDLKFIFWGTPDVASETLEILKQNGYLPMLIVTAPDKPQGRKFTLTPPPVKTWAIENNIPFIQPEKISGNIFENFFQENKILDVLRTLGRSDGDRQREFEASNSRGEQNIQDFIFIDLFVVVAYGKILPEEIINMPKFGSINIHYSLLPKHRGASPVESAILNDEKETGVTIQKMVYKMDAGPIIAKEETEILPTETTEELRKKLIKIGGELLVKILPPYLENKITLTEQKEEDATFCKKTKKEDGLLDLTKDDQKEMYNKYRAYHKWPRVYFIENNKRVIITEASFEDEKFVIKKVIPEGKKETDYKVYLSNLSK